MASFTMDGATIITKSGSTTSIADGTLLPSGSILQVQYTQYDSSAIMTSVTNSSYQTLCNGASGAGTEILNVTITPRKTGSTMWCQFMLHFEPNEGVSNNYDVVWLLDRVSGGSTTHLQNSNTAITRRGIGLTAQGYYSNDADTTMDIVNFQYFDLHGVTAGVPITYKPVVFPGNSMTSICINRVSDTGSSTSHQNQEGTVSSLAILEIAP